MFRYDDEYTETAWRYEADAQELAERDRDLRDMDEYPPPMSAKEAEEARRYELIGPAFADDAGPIGMDPEHPIIVSYPGKTATQNRKKAA